MNDIKFLKLTMAETKGLEGEVFIAIDKIIAIKQLEDYTSIFVNSPDEDYPWRVSEKASQIINTIENRKEDF